MSFFIDTCRPNRKSQQRRVIIATPIAESSITIDGVTAVVDSGLARAPCYDAATGISRLLTQRISQDSAEQRRGRAGRTQPGESWLAWHMTFSVIEYRISTEAVCHSNPTAYSSCYCINHDEWHAQGS